VKIEEGDVYVALDQDPIKLASDHYAYMGLYKKDEKKPPKPWSEVGEGRK
jgi:hypothetical protein